MLETLKSLLVTTIVFTSVLVTREGQMTWERRCLPFREDEGVMHIRTIKCW